MVIEVSMIEVYCLGTEVFSLNYITMVSGGVRTLKEKLEEIEDDNNHVSVNRLGVSDCAQYFVLMFTHHV